MKRNSSQATPTIPNEGSKGKPMLPTDWTTGLIVGTQILSGGADTDENGPACMVTLPSAAHARNGSCVANDELGQSTGKQKGANHCGPAVMANPQKIIIDIGMDRSDTDLICTNNEFSQDDNNEFRGVNFLKNDVWPGRYQFPSFHNDEAFVVSKIRTRQSTKSDISLNSSIKEVQALTQTLS